VKELIVASSWDNSLIDGFAEFPQVKWIFCKLDADIIGGGRTSPSLPKITHKQAKEHIQFAQSKGIKCNYLYNASCLGNQEFDGKAHKQIIQELDWTVHELQVEGITVSNNYLFRLLRRRYPKLKVGLGVFSKIWNLELFKYYEDCGAAWITVLNSFYRDLPFMEKLRKKIKCDLHIMVNLPDLPWCPHQLYHANNLGHKSQSSNKTNKSWEDYCAWDCIKTKIEDPKLLLKSDYVRPEDLTVYKQMGYKHFKIVGRTKSTEWILAAVKAYHDEKYKGNLLDIVPLGILADKQGACNDASKNFTKYFRKNYDKDKNWMKLYTGRYQDGVPFIDNQELDGFLKKQAPGLCNATECNDCGKCDKIFKKAIKFKNPKITKQLKANLQDSLDAFLRNKL